MKFQLVRKVHGAVIVTEQLSSLQYFQELIFSNWTSVWKLLPYMLFDTIVCFVQSAPLTLPALKDSEAFFFYVVPSKIILFSLVDTALNIFLSESGTYFLTPEKW